MVFGGEMIPDILVVSLVLAACAYTVHVLADLYFMVKDYRDSKN